LYCSVTLVQRVIGARLPSAVWGRWWLYWCSHAGRLLGGLSLRCSAYVGPFLEQGPVEPFDLAVGLGAADPGAGVLDAQSLVLIAPGMAEVGGTVVGQDPFDADAVAGEERPGSGQNANAVAAVSSSRASL
jgi:hypothetical protein